MEQLEVYVVGLSSLSWVIIRDDIFGGVGLRRIEVGECVDGLFSIIAR